MGKEQDGKQERPGHTLDTPSCCPPPKRRRATQDTQLLLLLLKGKPERKARVPLVVRAQAGLRQLVGVEGGC
eukprot:365396-Chlamydomonas_euryale.AAC.21